MRSTIANECQLQDQSGTGVLALIDSHLRVLTASVRAGNFEPPFSASARISGVAAISPETRLRRPKIEKLTIICHKSVAWLYPA